ARQWSYETARPGAGVVPKALSHNHESRNRHHQRRPAPGKQTAYPNLRLFIARERDIGGALTIHSQMALTTGCRGSGGPAELTILAASEAIEGPCPSFVCFGASWPVDCCSCSRQQVAQV